jgi:hypothetical protein
MEIPMMHSLSILCGIVVLSGTAQAAELDLSKLPPASSKAGVTFEKDIHPLFQESCVRCHGAERPKAGLRLDSVDAALKGSKNGKVIIPGDSAKSDLVIAIAHIDPELAMPPKRQGRGQGNRPQNPPEAGAAQPPGNGQPRGPQGPPARPLTPAEVGLVRAWIDQGAK